MRTIALCFNTPGMNEIEWVKPAYGKKYPGAGWMRHLPTLSQDGVPHVISGSGSLRLIQDKTLSAKDVQIVQEESNPDGILLAKLGAQKRVIICLESPIFASSFYDCLADQGDQRSQGWANRILFSGSTQHLFFPSYDTQDIRDPLPWANRKFLCMVTANKHYAALNPALNESPSFQWAMQTQLHDYRAHAIQRFWQSSGFTLYGRGWGEIAEECSDKLETISQYKFALCFENGSYPGYITEKIIDCFVAGVVPIYMGAPDIEKYIPRGLFIDANQFKSFQEMDEYLREHQDVNLMHMVRDAQEWLCIGNGMKYNNRNFASRILEMCE